MQQSGIIGELFLEITPPRERTVYIADVDKKSVLHADDSVQMELDDKFYDIENAIYHFKEMINEGADIIDIGGESTRPNAEFVTVDEEIKRVIPVIEKIRKINDTIPISIDTRNYKTAKNAIDAGADIINDVSGLDYDKELFEYVTKNNIPVIIMHSDKVPASSKNYTDCNDNYFLLSYNQ